MQRGGLASIWLEAPIALIFTVALCQNAARCSSEDSILGIFPMVEPELDQSLRTEDRLGSTRESRALDVPLSLLRSPCSVTQARRVLDS